jgi:protein SCO1
MRTKFSIWFFVAVVVLFPMGVFAVVKWYENRYTALPVLGSKGHVVHDFQLVDQNGNSASLHQWKNKIVVANVFFTHCPVVCPKMTRNLKNVTRVFINRADVLITSFTVDPERDSVPRLNSYAQQMDINGNWLLLTGDKKDIYKLARKSLLLVATDGDGGPDDFIHSEMLVLLDRQQRIRGFYKGTDAKEVRALISDLEKLRNEK